MKQYPRVPFIWNTATNVPIRLIFTKKEQQKLIKYITLHLLNNFLDLVGVAITGILGSLLITITSSRKPTGIVGKVISAIGLENQDFKIQVTILAMLTVSLLGLKSYFSLKISSSTQVFLGHKAFNLSDKYISILFGRPLQEIESKSKQENIYALTAGINALVMGIVFAEIQLVVDLFLVLILIISLMFVDLYIALFSIVIFTTLSFFLNKKVNKYSRQLSEEQTLLNIRSSEKLLEMIKSYREMHVMGSKQFFLNEISKIRYLQTITTSKINLIGFKNKYFFEIVVLISTYTVVGIEFALWSAQHAVAVLSVFLAAISRLGPTVMRIQQSLISIKTSTGLASPAVSMLRKLDTHSNSITFDFPTESFENEIQMSAVTVSYDGYTNVLENINLGIHKGERIGLVGPTGAGKSTLVDTILGIIKPISGQVTIKGTPIEIFIKNNPGFISYVPQNVNLIRGTIKDNIIFGDTRRIYSDSELNLICSKVRLDDFVQESPLGLYTEIGESNNELSGGQRQRLGLARALLKSPSIIVLDEATSSLDAITENEIMRTINNLSKDCTIVIIAHRLSTVRNLDRLIYLNHGKILAQGKFEDLRQEVPDFENQAKLLGL